LLTKAVVFPPLSLTTTKLVCWFRYPTTCELGYSSFKSAKPHHFNAWC